MKERGAAEQENRTDSRRGEEEGKSSARRPPHFICLFHVARYHFEIKTLPGE
jgi:hypothetical protein